MNPAARGSLGGQALAAVSKRRRQERVEDVEFLLAERVDPATAADRLGLAPGTLARSLTRAGRPDLARPFWRVDRLLKFGECRFCGGETSRKTNTCCQPCRPLARMETINNNRKAA